MLSTFSLLTSEIISPISKLLSSSSTLVTSIPESLLIIVMPSDIIFFQAGVDILDSDGLGHLSLSRSGLIERNEMVFDFAKKRDSPIVVFMGGGYSKPIKHTVKSFVDLFEQCALHPGK